MSDVSIVFALIVAALVLFIRQKIPAVLVAIIVPLVLFFTGILNANQAVGGSRPTSTSPSNRNKVAMESRIPCSIATRGSARW